MQGIVHLFNGLKGLVVLSVQRMVGLLETPLPWHATISKESVKGIEPAAWVWVGPDPRFQPRVNSLFQSQKL